MRLSDPTSRPLKLMQNQRSTPSTPDVAQRRRLPLLTPARVFAALNARPAAVAIRRSTAPRLRLALSLSLPLLLSAGAAAAEESRVAAQAIRCSAVFAVFVNANAEDAALSAKFSKAQRIFDEVYAGERRDKRGDAHEEIVAKRSALLQEFRDNFREREPYLHEEGVLCGAWAEGFLAQGERWSFIPVIPKVIAASARAEYSRIGPASFTRWAK